MTTAGIAHRAASKAIGTSSLSRFRWARGKQTPPGSAGALQDNGRLL